MNHQEVDALREYLRADLKKRIRPWTRLDWLNVLTWFIVAVAGVAFWALILSLAIGALIP